MKWVAEDAASHFRSELTEEQWNTLGAYWWQRAEGERTSWAAFKQVCQDLTQLRAPSPIIELAHRAVEDEWRHSEWCRDWAVAFGHRKEEPQIRTDEVLTFKGARDDEQPLLRILLCCMTETTGCVLLDLVRDLVTDQELREQNHQHLKDELQHSRVGWAYLATLTEQQKAVVRRFAPQLIRELNRIMSDEAEQDRLDLVEYGYFPRSLQMEAARQATEELIIPGLKEQGLWGQA